MKIVFLISQSFPFGTAYASRAQNFCKAFLQTKHNIDVICDYLSDEQYRNYNNVGQFENIRIFYLAKKRKKLDRFMVPIKYSRLLEWYIITEKPDLIITRSAYDRFPYILKMAQKNSIPIILESCEKYDVSNWRFGKLDYRYYQFQCCWNKYYSKVDGVIAISRLLQKHYANYNLKTIRIPTILDVQNSEYRIECNNSSQRVFTFAGTLGGGKDRLAEFIQAMYDIGKNTEVIPILNIYGPSREQVEKQLGEEKDILKKLEDRINFFGKIPQEKVPAVVRKSDFSIILRPVRESSNAGFPTKLAESMAVGTPVFTNITGDIGLYVKDAYNGVITQSEKKKDIVERLKYILNMNEKEIIMMRNAARRTAIDSFDFRSYEEGLHQFICDIINGGEKNVI